MYNNIPLGGIPIILTTKSIQRKKHRKKRINKKWAKKYGFIEIDVQADEIIFSEDKLFVTKRGFEKLKGVIRDAI